jgi:8-oxo-dGTP diphosphatase
VNLRRSSRAIILDQDDRVLLCRLDLTATGGPTVWVTPGGGVEPGESALQTMHRELDEELGLRIDHDALLVWCEEATGPQYAPGYDGVDVFGPRDLATRLEALLTDGPPATPLHI